MKCEVTVNENEQVNYRIRISAAVQIQNHNTPTGLTHIQAVNANVNPFKR